MNRPIYTLDDPRPIAAGAPYTFFLPRPTDLAALAPGDMAQLIFRPLTPTKWGAERMWVTVTAVAGDAFTGVLESKPDDMPGVSQGETVNFNRWNVIALMFGEGRTDVPLPETPRREYWERCMVDQAVVDGELKVGYLYREEPEFTQPEDKYPDSGWRIRGDFSGATMEEIEAREPAYVAIGSVLNCDDSWLHLIDEPVGSAFDRDFATNTYVPARS